MKRRAFLEVGVLGTAALAMGARVWPLRQGTIKKAVKFDMVREELSILQKFELLKSLGFDGVEVGSSSALDRDEVIAARDATGLPIHGVVNSVHWQKPLSHADEAVRAEGLAGLLAALDDAHAYGASTVLLVPAVVTKGVSYADAYKRSQGEVRKALPMAEDMNVKIAFENVWNQFLLSPLECVRYVDEFESDAVGWYFDVGNVINYGWPEHWIYTLGHRILKLDIKEYSRDKRDREGPYAGFNVPLGEGDCDWPAVTAALADIGFEGWATAEIAGGDRVRLQEIARRMDRILPT